jgi:A/G-specific adenine glycosylase
MSVSLSEHILYWYSQHARSLPWRGHPDPYAVWVSEIMLQQTRVEAVIPYFERWMEKFPTVKALARASEGEVLSAWEGLGYYSRARNLHRAAQMVVEEYNGEIPREPDRLRRLPGIGRYTAGAIASIAFGEDAAALDGKIRRVLARVFNVDLIANSTPGERRLWSLAEQHLPAGRAGEYNQALMDLGATICTPREPRCLLCPLQEICQARALGIQEQRPVLPQKPEIPHYLVTAAVIRRDGEVLIARRPSKGLLGGMWEFPGGKVQEGEELPACLQREICEELDAEVSVGRYLGEFHHAYTHFKVTLHAFECAVEKGEPRPVEASDMRWVNPGELDRYPMGKIDRQIARKLQDG